MTRNDEKCAANATPLQLSPSDVQLGPESVAVDRKSEIAADEPQCRFDTQEFLTFCTRLIAGVDTKIHLVLDGHPVHRSKATKAWMIEHADRIELHFLPAYAPHLNPDELVNADLERTLADKSIVGRDQMELAVRSFFSGGYRSCLAMFAGISKRHTRLRFNRLITGQYQTINT